MALGLICSTLVDKIRNLPAEKQSEKTLLMDYYIRLLNSPDNFEQLKEMATSSQLTVEETKFVGDLNKLQRYTCLRKCAAVVSNESEAQEVKALVEEEKKRDFSDVDEMEYVKFLGSLPLESDKMTLFNLMI